MRENSRKSSESDAKTLPSPYALDAASELHSRGQAVAALKGQRIFFDGVLKGDYSLAIVNRQLIRALLRMGADVTVHTPEADWKSDAMLQSMPDVRDRCSDKYPERDRFDVHLRNTWPPRADDMVGRFNAYVCFAWEEPEAPRSMIEHFNAHLDLIMVTSNFVEQSFRRSGLAIPIAVVGNGVDHVLGTSQPNAPAPSDRARILHVSSCFPRKGVDALVKAFASEFSSADPVELVIKTFDNPHNTIETIVEQAQTQHPNAAPIQIVKASLTQERLIALIRGSSVLAAPSRGEGFGLPLAEALLLDVPVVTTGFSGQTDFCTDETAWLVDYRMTRSTAHVAASDATWAEPDLGSLARQLRRAVERRGESERKVRNGQALLRAHFKWSDVALRVAHAVHATKHARDEARQSEFKIDLVSTWAQICGVATYSSHLLGTSTLAPSLNLVLARQIHDDALPTQASSLNPYIRRVWSNDMAGIGRLAVELSRGSGDILWIQHHPGFFSDGDMEMIASALAASAYRAKVITLHNVRETLKEPAHWLSAFDVVIVHTAQDAELLAEASACPVSVIPHGIVGREGVGGRQSGRFTIGTFGFLYPHKNIPLLIEGFALARRVVPELTLKLLTCVRSDPKSWMERARVEAIIEALALGDSVEADFSFLSDEEIAERLSGCDLLCFPYGASNESATGAVRIALAADRPLLCSQSTVFDDIRSCSLNLARLDAASLAEALIVLATHPEVRTLRDQERRRYVEQHSYESMAVRHGDIFQKIMRARAHA